MVNKDSCLYRKIILKIKTEPRNLVRMQILKYVLILFIVSSGFIHSQGAEVKESMIEHPEWYLKIKDWSFYVARGVAILSHVTIENTSAVAYKNIKVKVNYYSSDAPHPGQLVSSTTGVLPITVPPKSKDTYLEGGITLGAGSYQYRTWYIEILEATPVIP